MTIEKTQTGAETSDAETIDETFEVGDAKGLRVDVANTNGPIFIEAWDQPRVWIHAVKRGGSRTALGKTAVEITQDGNGIRAKTIIDKEGGRGLLDLLRGGIRGVSVEYTVKLPADGAVTVETVNGSIAVNGLTRSTEAKTLNGSLLLKGVGGASHGETVNGQIVAENLTGDTELRVQNGSLKLIAARLQNLDGTTTNGSIQAELKIQPHGSYSLGTTNGSCKLMLPGNSRCHIRAEAVNGSISNELPAHEIRAANRPGANLWEAELNGGGAEIEFKTVNGSLKILAAEHAVEEDAAEEIGAGPDIEESDESRRMEILRAIERGEISVEDALKKF